ncbi:MAG: alpha/beta hydrolase [bacterium]|nr:alpha/beta hydrolase [bacterium]
MKHLKIGLTSILTVLLLFFSGSTYSQGRYMNVNGLKMYYEIKGKGQPLLFIHGGGVCIDAYRSEIELLSKKYKVIAAENQAQGRTNDIDREISYENMANDQILLLDSLGIDSIIVFGHSDGGIVGLHMTISNPKRIKKLIIAGTNYQANGILDEYTEMLKNATPELFQNDFYKKLSPDGYEHWPVVMNKLKRMWLNEPNLTERQLNLIRQQTLIIVGDNDMIKIRHTINMFENITNANLLIVPNSTHEVLSEKQDFVFPLIFDFIEKNNKNNK